MTCSPSISGPIIGAAATIAAVGPASRISSSALQSGIGTRFDVFAVAQDALDHGAPADRCFDARRRVRPAAAETR